MSSVRDCCLTRRALCACVCVQNVCDNGMDSPHVGSMIETIARNSSTSHPALVIFEVTRARASSQCTHYRAQTVDWQ